MSKQKQDEQAIADLPITIDQEAKTITLRLEDDSVHTLSIEKLMGFLVWLKEREPELRRLVFSQFPVSIKQPMRLNAFGYYTGCTEDRQLVRVEAARYEEVMQAESEKARKMYFDGIDADKGNTFFNRLDAELGIEHPQIAKYDHDIMANEAVEQARANVRRPEWWLHKPDNLDAGKVALLP